MSIDQSDNFAWPTKSGQVFIARWLTFMIAIFALPLISACTGMSTLNERRSALELGKEYVPPGEESLIDQIVAIHSDIQDHADLRHSPVPRGQHPKQHGCVSAQFIIEPNLPAILKHGVFQERHIFQAVIRFSNGRKFDDTEADAHGMAVKLLDVGGPKIGIDDYESTTQDFVMMDNPVFFVRNVEEYVPLIKDFRAVAIGGTVSKFLAGMKFLFSPDREHRLMRTAASKRPDSPLTIQYWSTTPSKLGNLAMKFSARPTAGIIGPNPEKSDSPDKLRLALAERLKSQSASFDFLVQPQTDARLMPIEDPTVLWDENISPPVKVATIVIPVQNFESAEQMKVCENLSFTPWHALAAMRPLGGINRARKKVYEVLSKRRREANGTSVREP